MTAMRDILTANGFTLNPKNNGFCPVCGGGAWSYIKRVGNVTAECRVNIKNTTAGQEEKGTGMLYYKGATRVLTSNIQTVLNYHGLAESVEAK